MKQYFVVSGKKRFADIAAALAYANRIFQRTGVIVSVEARKGK